MAVVDLTDLRFQNAPPSLVTLGGVVRGPFGGATYIGRQGDRWQRQYVTRPMREEPNGRRFRAMLQMATREGGLFHIPQPGFSIGAPGSPVVAEDTASGRSVPLAGLTPHYAIRIGQWLSFVSGGRRYCDQVTAQVIAGADGTAVVTIQNLLRAPLSEGDVVELGSPKMEGTVEGDFGGDLAADQIAQFSFTVIEDR
jgi:hypothetical protein